MCDIYATCCKEVSSKSSAVEIRGGGEGGARNRHRLTPENTTAELAMNVRPPSRQDDMLPWDDLTGRPRSLQRDFASIWYGEADWARIRAQHLAQDAMKVQVDRLRAKAGEDEGAAPVAGADQDIVEDT